MNLPDSTKIKETQNTEDNIRIQCAAGYYFNRAEMLNYVCWLICIVSSIVSFWSNYLPVAIAMAIMDISALVLGIATNYNTKNAADLRKLFDAHVIFGDSGGFEEAEIRKLNEKAICITKMHEKDYEIISKSDGRGRPPGKKDWYVFSSNKEPLFAQLECQAQNKWWNDKMVSRRIWVLFFVIFATIVGYIFLFNKLSLSVIGMINAIVIILVRLIERGIQYWRYHNISIRIDTMYETTMKNIAKHKICELQKYIDDRRHLPIFEMNIIHKISAAKLTMLYEVIPKD